MGDTMRRELDKIEAASKPLPLQDDEEELRLKGKGKGKAGGESDGGQMVNESGSGAPLESPLGPL